VLISLQVAKGNRLENSAHFPDVKMPRGLPRGVSLNNQDIYLYIYRLRSGKVFLPVFHWPGFTIVESSIIIIVPPLYLAS
jgi:hypothetical protein